MKKGERKSVVREKDTEEIEVAEKNVVTKGPAKCTFVSDGVYKYVDDEGKGA
jgi:hypothetical protein